MPKHGTASLGPHAEFLGAGVRALILISDDLDPEVRTKWAGAKGEELQSVLREALISQPVLLTPEQSAVGIVKTVPIQIGGGRTTDQMVEVARKDGLSIDSVITQANMPSGYGKLRPVTLEFRQFDHDPYTDEVCEWIEQPGFGHPTYEDGLRFQEARPEDQRKFPHIFVPEAPWCDAGGVPCALGLWGIAGSRGLNLDGCKPRRRWHQDCLFARRKY